MVVETGLDVGRRINMFAVIEALFAIIGVLTTLFVVAVIVYGDRIVKYLEETVQVLQARNEQRKTEKEDGVAN